ncbi:MAG TPA: FKBP-type peptidyl-prolyl cis-trans isomerase [Candidatus Saccharimonadales bacterium]|nr:FKBP-type peptidyl-prolyl cis-trans isomerase [Candidatus Saccharimonadales bacterium]
MNKKYLFVTIFLVALIIAGGIAIFSRKGSANNQPLATVVPTATIEPTAESTVVPTATGSAKPLTQVDKLIIQDENVGTGIEAITGKKVTVNYTGTLTDGTKFDSSLNPGRTPFEFTLGAGEVIAGWDQGVAGMKVGGKRKLTIPASLGYGDQGAGNLIPPGATLIFEVELLKVE